MKLRLGLVSNSSSGSFMIVGTECSKLIDELRKAIIKKDKKFMKEDGHDGLFYGSETYDDLEVFTEGEMADDGYKHIYHIGIPVAGGDGSIKIGVDEAISKMQDARKKAIVAFSKILGHPVEERQIHLIAGESSNGG